MRKRDKMKSVYVVKDAPKDIDAKHKELNTKSVYLLKNAEQTIERCRDTVFDFVDEQAGLFVIISEDKRFYQNFRNSFYKELQIEQERIRLVANKHRALDEIRVYKEYQKKPLVFLESVLNNKSTLPFLEEIKTEFKDMFVIVLMAERDEKLIAQFVEAGADNFITKPVSVNILVEKIANTLVPQDEVGKKIREGKERLRKVEFALAYGVARDILVMKPGSPAALIIMGDALKGLSKRDDALKMYIKASENATMFLDPLKKIVDFHKEDGNQDGALKYLEKIDTLSPHHLGRKKELGELHYMLGNHAAAAQYFLDAVQLVHEQKEPECVRMAEDYADKIFNSNEKMAEPLLANCTKLARSYRIDLDATVFNRLGMLLRRRKCWEEAVGAYTEASLRSPQDESILFNLGMAYVEGKDMGSAAQKFERAMTINPAIYIDNIPAAYVMGQVFIRANRHNNAKVVLQHVFSVDPEFKKVKALLSSIK